MKKLIKNKHINSTYQIIRENLLSVILKFHLFILFIIILYSCAVQAELEGGEIDKLPPKIIKTVPPNFSINIKPQKITIFFDEYIIVSDLNKNLITSPLINFNFKTYPKKLSIFITDTLKENQTYQLFFDKAIKDFNEGNVLNNFLFVFSTGNQIDTFSFKGKVLDAFTLKPEKDFIIGLYLDTSDSCVYNKPNYITRTDINGYFHFNYVKNNTYKLVAFNDIDNNYIWNKANEKIAFLDSLINLANTKNIILFSFFEDIEKTFLKNIFFFDSNKIYFEFNKKLYNSPKIIIKDFDSTDYIMSISNNLTEGYIILKKNFSTDSLQLLFIYTIDSLSHLYNKELQTKIAKNFIKKISLQDITWSVQNNSKIIPSDTISIKLLPDLYDSLKVKLYTKNDTIWNELENFKILKDSLDKFKFLILYDFLLGKSYKIEIEIKKNEKLLKDSLFFNVYNEDELGSLNIKIENLNTCAILQLLNNDKVEKSFFLNNTDTLKIKYLLPGEYTIKIIEDYNCNGKWDNGSYIAKILPEKVIIFEEKIKVRKNWGINININVKKE